MKNSSVDYRDHWTVLAGCTDWDACPPCAFVTKDGHNLAAQLDALYETYNIDCSGYDAMYSAESGYVNGEIFSAYLTKVRLCCNGCPLHVGGRF